ncbi:hypothetical protein [Fischerella sp. NIES-3754]
MRKMFLYTTCRIEVKELSTINPAAFGCLIARSIAIAPPKE